MRHDEIDHCERSVAGSSLVLWEPVRVSVMKKLLEYVIFVGLFLFVLGLLLVAIPIAVVGAGVGAAAAVVYIAFKKATEEA